MNRFVNLLRAYLDRGKPAAPAQPDAATTPSRPRPVTAPAMTPSVLDRLDPHFADARALVDSGRGRHAVDSGTQLISAVPAAIAPAPPLAASPTTVPAPEVPAVDVELLRRVLERITAHPEKWDQATWWEYGDDLASECGTVGCLAGWTVALGRPDLIVDEFGIHRVVEAPGERLPLMHVRQTARHLLGLPERAAERLFNAKNTLRDLWELAEFFTLGAITVPAELPDGS